MIPPPVATAASVAAANAGRRNRPGRASRGPSGARPPRTRPAARSRRPSRPITSGRPQPSRPSVSPASTAAHAERQQHHARYVEPGPVPDARLVAAACGRAPARPPPPPARRTRPPGADLRQPRREQRAERDPGPDAGAPDTGRAGAPCGSGKATAIMPEAGREHRRATDALHDPGDHEGTDLGRDARRAANRPRGPAAPATKVRRRPKSSATRPAVSRNAPRPMLIELRIQVRPEVPASRPATVRLTVASGAVKATSATRVPSEAVTRVRRAAVTGTPVGLMIEPE